MPETRLVWLAAVKLFLVFAFAMCYTMGGRTQRWRHGKVWRRYVGALILGLGTCGLALAAGTFRLPMLISVGAFAAALSLGYGADDVATKLRRRSLYGLAVGVAGLPLALGGGTLGLWLVQTAFAIMISVGLGVWNPARSAVEEETMIAVGSTFMLPFYV